MAESFWLGAFAKAVATVVSFPFSRAKVMITTGSISDEEGVEGSEKEGENRQKKSAIVVLYEVLRRDGVVSLYQGLTPSLTKAVLQSAIMLMVREKVDQYSRGAVLALFQK